jgi:hypothetical protein
LDFWFENLPSGNPGAFHLLLLAATDVCNQGRDKELCDQIGRTFAVWAIFLFWGIFFLRKSPKIHPNMILILPFFCPEILKF